MTDKLNELGKNLHQIKYNSEFALTRDYTLVPLIEHVRDIFDPEFPFEMTFDVPSPTMRDVKLNLKIYPPPASDCFAGNTQFGCETHTTGHTFISPYPFINVIVYYVFDPDIGEEQLTIGETQYYTVPDNQTVIIADFLDINEVNYVKVCYVYTPTGCFGSEGDGTPVPNPGGDDTSGGSGDGRGGTGSFPPPTFTEALELKFPLNPLTVGPMGPNGNEAEWEMFSRSLYSGTNPFSAVLDPTGSGLVVVRNVNRLNETEKHTTYGTTRDMPLGTTAYAAFSWLWLNSSEYNPIGWSLIWQRQMVGSPIAALSVENSTKRWFMMSRDNTTPTKFDIAPIQYGHWAFCVVGIHQDYAPAGWLEWWFSHDSWPDISQPPMHRRTGITTYQGDIAHDTMGMYAEHFSGSSVQYVGYGLEYGRASTAARAVEIARVR